MFISTSDKKHLLDQAKIISALIKDMSLAATEITALKAKIKVLEGKKTPAKKKLTEAQRAKQREYARRYNAKKKLEKQNGNSVSTTGV